MRKHRREEIAGTAHNRLAGSVLLQGRTLAGPDKPMKQEAYARKLAASLGLDGLARQTLSAWERGTTVVPAAALLASADVIGVEVGSLIEGARKTVKARITALEEQLAEADRITAPGNGESAVSQPSVRAEAAPSRR